MHRMVGLMIAMACGLAAPNAADGAWRMVWQDEFDRDGHPDPAKWGYEEGYVRNNEVQYYMRRRLKNARVEKGLLVIEAHRENMPNPRHDGSSSRWQRRQRTVEYTSASLTTAGKASWTYGRIEVRARVPRGQGVWPAIWMLGVQRSQVGYPKCGEIDIMEFVGHTPDTIYGTMHYPPRKPESGRIKDSKGGKIKVVEPWKDFHVYAIEWTPERIDFFFDDQKYFSFQIDEAGRGPENPFRKPQYLLINCALGGSWGGQVDDSNLPQRYEIDYVRVYEQAGSTARRTAEIQPASRN
ncbi:MAG: glycoside hydrolase family 16 protein [Kiritimatiellae bacterium]|nr:glycoside hydrolase family 16 protein [Kiritimatiellia bacterium]